MKKKEIVLTVVKAGLALALFLVAILNYDRLSKLDVVAVLSFTDRIWLMCLTVLLIYVVKALVFVIPASVVYVAVGAVLPTPLAVAMNMLGIFFEISVTYVLGRFLGKDVVYKLLSKKEAGRKLLAKKLGDKSSVLFTIRAVPAFPIDFVSLFYGASGCGYPKYALFSVAGLAWRVILFTILGDALFAWIPMDKIILLVICCIPVGVAYYLIKKLILNPKKTAKEKEM